MKIGILDDEKSAVKTLEGFLQKYSDDEHLNIEIQSFFSPEQFLSTYDNSFDILFLDVNMPGKNGLATAKLIRELDEDVVIVFVTNMAKYAIRGYEVHAADYILKPISYSDFIMKFKKAIKYIVTDKNKFYCVKTEEGIINIPVSSIKYVEVFKNYLHVHTTSKTFMVRSSLREAQEHLEQYDFARINNCYLINMKYVKKIKDDAVDIGGDLLQISRNRKSAFLQSYFKFVGKV